MMGIHKDSNGKNDGYEFPDLGTLRWHPKVKDIESTEIAQAEGKIITEDMVNGNDCRSGECL